MQYETNNNNVAPDEAYASDDSIVDKNYLPSNTSDNESVEIPRKVSKKLTKKKSEKCRFLGKKINEKEIET
ncbi:hypothetical protein QE152_g29366 [Popillia japonica]|uniref:Uncharacterized protein n=1 Tax=Popillia japonica TaxID=7064 RepID=A0AAW1JH87_POPJA